MSYCFNPHCHQPKNEPQQDVCNSCGADLLLKKRYRGVKPLGKSQLASTIEVRDVSSDPLEPSDRKVVKILITDYHKAVYLFQQEAQILRQINHPGIPKIASDGYFRFQPKWSKNPIHCMVIEKIPGLDLEQWLRSRGNQPVTEEMVQDWLKQLLDILKQLHQQQYFHRDIKPANIILQPNGKLVLIDFGAARKVSSTYLGKVGVQQGVTSIGTPGYIAPEQIDGAALPQSDFFALGRTLVHLSTGKHPQELPKDLNTGKILWKDEESGISESFANLLDSLIEHLPSKRPVNIDAILHRLGEAQRFPHQSSKKSAFQLKLTLSMALGLVLSPLSILGILGLRENINQQVATEDIANTTLCNNLTCVNRDPIDNKCDRDAQTITSDIGNYKIEQHLLKAYRLEIRFSPACQSTWTRSQAPVDSSHYIEDRQGTKYGSAIVPVDQWQEHYTDMAPGKNIEVRACAEPPSGKKKCTNFVRL